VSISNRVANRFAASWQLPEGMEGFDDIPARKLTPSEEVRVEIERKVGTYPNALAASSYIKPAGLRGIEDKIYEFPRKQAWMIVTEAKDKSEARRLGLNVQKNLVGKKALNSSQPYLHQDKLYVVFLDGYVELEGLPKEAPPNRDKSNLKYDMLRKAKPVFGARGVSLSGL
jgi:hypothetical protein